MQFKFNHELDSFHEAIGVKENQAIELIEKINKITEDEEINETSVFLEKICENCSKEEIAYIFVNELNNHRHTKEKLVNFMDTLMSRIIPEGEA